MLRNTIAVVTITYPATVIDNSIMIIASLEANGCEVVTSANATTRASKVSIPYSTV
jgi:hypothetical protein